MNGAPSFGVTGEAAGATAGLVGGVRVRKSSGLMAVMLLAQKMVFSFSGGRTVVEVGVAGGWFEV